MLVALGFLAVLAALLAIPIEVDFRVSGVPVKDDVRLAWAFGLVRVRLGATATEPVHEAAESRAIEPERSSKGRGRSNLLAALRQRDFRQALLQAARGLWRVVRKDDIRLTACLGLGDPAETGRLWALLGPLCGWLRSLDDVDIRIDPDFGAARLDFAGSGRVGVVPLEVLGIVLRLALSPPFWRGMRAMRK
jgi:hypothetical protein